jgi:thioredoxin-related protein
MNQSQRQAQGNLSEEERCVIHPRELHIAVEEATNVFACNKCVFEKRIKKPLFLASFAYKTKHRYDEEYAKLHVNISKSEEISTNQISNRISMQVQELFQNLYR